MGQYISEIYIPSAGERGWRPSVDLDLRRLGELHFNVKGGSNPAVGDGVADDMAAIQGKLNSCALAGGGTVFLPAGMYKVSSPLLVPNNTRLLGVGKGNWVHTTVTHPTMIQAAPGFVGAAVIDITGGNSLVTPKEAITIQGLYVDCANVSGIHGIKVWNFKDVKLKEVKVRRTAAASLLTGADASGSNYILTVDSCLFANGFDGVSTTGTAKQVFINFHNLDLKNLTGDGIRGWFMGTIDRGQYQRIDGWGVELTDTSQSVTMLGLLFENCGLLGTNEGGDIHTTNTDIQNVVILGGQSAHTNDALTGRLKSVWIEACNGGGIFGFQISAGDITVEPNLVGLTLASEVRRFAELGTRYEAFTGTQVERSVTTHITDRGLEVYGGAFKAGSGATVNRPSAASVKHGAQWYDSTLNKPIWSDGTNWRDAAGTVV